MGLSLGYGNVGYSLIIHFENATNDFCNLNRVLPFLKHDLNKKKIIYEFSSR